ncbi:hypothetical protein GE061_003274 [Apolygus lucorum]|uniref:Uncharacterized protein n=1 Tax=Apolygus lucorum TaxID=248454 RepID=A0A8S9X3C2_APOLU|nr:hypothetical protein GE061_003274 [Apolygus lucorum]
MEGEIEVKEEPMSDGEADEGYQVLGELVMIKQEVLIVGEEGDEEQEYNYTPDPLGDESDVLQGSAGMQERSEVGPSISLRLISTQQLLPWRRRSQGKDPGSWTPSASKDGHQLRNNLQAISFLILGPGQDGGESTSQGISDPPSISYMFSSVQPDRPQATPMLTSQQPPTWTTAAIEIISKPLADTASTAFF